MSMIIDGDDRSSAHTLQKVYVKNSRIRLRVQREHFINFTINTIMTRTREFCVCT